MATISTINIGNVVNDGLGDDLRTAFQKVNSNFSALNAGLTITGTNLGTVGENVFKQKTGTEFEFRKLIAGNKITLISNPESIVISSTVPNAFNRITTNQGTMDANQFQLITIQGDADVNVSVNQDVITVGTVLDLNQILKTLDFGPIVPPYDNMVQFAVASGNIDFGTITNPGTVSYDLGSFAS